MNRNLSVAVLLLLGAILVGTADAQSGALDELYGRGVHAFYAREYSVAEQHFNAAIAQGSRDPRVYYFRGLIYDTRGSSNQAESDYRTGAELEMSGTTRSYNIGRSLIRIQGKCRLAIEQSRSDARLEALLKGKQPGTPNYGRKPANETEVLRDPNLTPDSESDPFADDLNLSGGEATPAPTPEPPAAGDTPPVTPAPDAPGETSPFGTDTPADAPNPFGTDTPADAPNPFGTDTPADAPNPFGGDTPPAENPFDAGGENPFGGGGGDMPAENPFGTGSTSTGSSVEKVADTRSAMPEKTPDTVGALFRALTKALPGGDKLAEPKPFPNLGSPVLGRMAVRPGEPGDSEISR